MKISLFINLVPTQIRFLLWLEKYNTINKILMDYENDLIKGTLKLGYYKEGGLHSRVFNRLRKLHLPEYADQGEYQASLDLIRKAWLDK